jgi:hypothetical protein
MTVICYDGKQMSGDKLSLGATVNLTTKVYRLSNGLLGVSGPSISAMAICEWAVGGFKEDMIPAFQKIPDSMCQVMFVDHDRNIWIYESSHLPWRSERGIHAIGGGAEVGLMAMLCGLSAPDAVRKACELVLTAGMGIDTISHESEEVVTMLFKDIALESRIK